MVNNVTNSSLPAIKNLISDFKLPLYNESHKRNMKIFEIFTTLWSCEEYSQQHHHQQQQQQQQQQKEI